MAVSWAHVCFASWSDPDHRPRGHDTPPKRIRYVDVIHRAHFIPTRIDNMGATVKVGFCPVSVATLAERPAMAVVQGGPRCPLLEFPSYRSPDVVTFLLVQIFMNGIFSRRLRSRDSGFVPTYRRPQRVSSLPAPAFRSSPKLC